MDHEVVGSVSKPSAPKIYDVWRRRGGKERKVNKNLGEITVPGGGKLRLISCTRLSPSCLHLRSRSLTRSNLFPSLSLSPLYYIPPAATRKRSPYYYWEQSRRRIVRGREGSRPTYFTFLPKRGPTISSSYSPFTPPRRRASNGWCMQRYTRARPLVYLLSRVALTREFANRTRKIAVSLTCFFPTRALPFRSKSRRNEEEEEKNEKKKRWQIFFEPKESFSNK